MRIAHVGAFNGRNWGDACIQRSMHDLFAAYADVEWLTYDCQSTVFTPRVIDEINREADVLVVGGGGLIWDRPGLNSPSGWQWRIQTADIDLIEIPLIVFAVGWNEFPRDLTREHPNLTRSLRSTLKKAEYFTVRNEGTKERLKEVIHPTSVSSVEVVADPAFFLRAEKANQRLRLPKRNPEGVLGLCLTLDQPHLRYHRTLYSLDEAETFRELATAVEARIKVRGGDVWIVNHLHGQDEASFFADGFLHGCMTHVINLPKPTAENAPTLADIYAQCDEVWSMRKHGLIVAAGQGVRTVPVGNHQEVQWCQEFIEDRITLKTRKTELELFIRDSIVPLAA